MKWLASIIEFEPLPRRAPCTEAEQEDGRVSSISWRATVALVCWATIWIGNHSVAGPKEGGKSLSNVIIKSDSPKALKLVFKGGERAGVLVVGDRKHDMDIYIEVRDSKGQLITKDDKGGEFCSVIWHPPHDAEYTIKITVIGKQPNKCYIAVR